MIGIDVLEHTERQLTADEAKDLYASWSDIVRIASAVFSVVYLFASVFPLISLWEITRSALTKAQTSAKAADNP